MFDDGQWWGYSAKKNHNAWGTDPERNKAPYALDWMFVKDDTDHLLPKRPFWKSGNDDSLGMNIRAAHVGIVERVDRNRNKNYGLAVYIRSAEKDDDGKTWVTLYAHLDWIDPRVKQDAKVEARQIIGKCGRMGPRAGPAAHLHFELLKANDKGTWVPQELPGILVDGKPLTLDGYYGKPMRRQ